MRTAFALVLFTILCASSLSAQPAWWGDYGVVHPDLPSNEDHQPAVQAQAKWAVFQAKAYLDDELALIGGSGTAITEFVENFSNERNQSVLTIGQAKYISSLFVDRLVEVGYIGSPLNPQHPKQYPWTAEPSDDADSAPCTIGQLKYLFSFDLDSFDAGIDSDQDGISDIIERNYGLDPFNPLDAQADQDGDGLTNYEEIILYSSNHNKKDSDLDGLSDYDEVIVYDSNPLSIDTDKDGISDQREITFFYTNPNIRDSDQDGRSDGQEVIAQTDPNDSADYSFEDNDKRIFTKITQKIESEAVRSKRFFFGDICVYEKISTTTNKNVIDLEIDNNGEGVIRDKFNQKEQIDNYEYSFTNPTVCILISTQSFEGDEVFDDYLTSNLANMYSLLASDERTFSFLQSCLNVDGITEKEELEITDLSSELKFSSHPANLKIVRELYKKYSEDDLKEYSNLRNTDPQIDCQKEIYLSRDSHHLKSPSFQNIELYNLNWNGKSTIVNDVVLSSLLDLDSFFDHSQDEAGVVELFLVDFLTDTNGDQKINHRDTLYGDKGISVDHPFRWWINNDNDSDAVSGFGDFSIDNGGNDQDFIVNGIRDLVDFFPIYMNFKGLLERIKRAYEIAGTSITLTLKLKHSENAFNFFEAPSEFNKDNVGFFLSEPTFAKKIESMELKNISEDATSLSNEFLQAIMDPSNSGKSSIIFLEAIQRTTEPIELLLEINVDGQVIEHSLHEFYVSVSPVEDMYRHVNLRDGASKTGTPPNLPVELTSDKYFAFVHGYNVDEQAARGWNAEVFKRLYQMGSKANFIGITWPGDVAPDYHKAVYRAFEKSTELAGALSFANGDLTIAAHSLGNMVVSNAMAKHSFSPNRYYMINAATPIEAYNAGQPDATMKNNMTENSWKPYAERLYSANWHTLFPESDNRNKLTWKNRFEPVTKFAYNFYSTGEDVVANAGSSESFARYSGSLLLEVLKTPIDGNKGKKAWVGQEISKGNDTASTLLSPYIRGGGWGFLPLLAKGEDRIHIRLHDPNPFGSYNRRREPDETSILNPEELAQYGFFDKFIDGEKLYAPIADQNRFQNISYSQSDASAEAGKDTVQWRMLAYMIPSWSYAAAANEIEGVVKNYNMMDMKSNNKWPRSDNDWYHSDFKNVALPYVAPVWRRMINEGMLDEN